MGGLDNPIHLIFLLVLMLLVFGAKRLPEMGRSLGSGLRGFRDALSGDVSARPELERGPLAPDAATATAPAHAGGAAAGDGSNAI